jgi:hypothetical protein
VYGLAKALTASGVRQRTIFDSKEHQCYTRRVLIGSVTTVFQGDEEALAADGVMGGTLCPVLLAAFCGSLRKVHGSADD